MMEEESPEQNVGASIPEPYSLPEEREMPVSNFSRREEIMSAKKELEELSSMDENPWKFMGDVNPTEGESDVGTSGSSIENVERLKDCFSRSVSELKCKQSVVSRINSMQEEEIAHLENMLKEEQMHRCNVAKEMKFLQQVKGKESSIASKRQEVSELEEPGSVPDASAVAQGEVEEVRDLNTTLSTRVSSLKDLLQEAKSQNTCANLGVKLANLKVKEMEVEAAHAQKELLETKLDLDAQVRKREAAENQYQHCEKIFQRNIANVKKQATEMENKCQKMEDMYHQMRNEKDRKIQHLRKEAHRVSKLEKQLETLHEENTETDFLLKELNYVLMRHIRKEAAPFDFAGCMTPDDMEDFFKEEKHLKYLRGPQERAESGKLVRGDLNATIDNLRRKLAKVNLRKSNMAVTPDEQEWMKNSPKRSREGKRTEDNEQLQSLLRKYEGKIDQLENELTSANLKLMKNRSSGAELGGEMLRLKGSGGGGSPSRASHRSPDFRNRMADRRESMGWVDADESLLHPRFEDERAETDRPKSPFGRSAYNDRKSP